MGKRISEAGVPQLSARERVYAVAADLFYRKSIRAVGVEEIAKEANVAKISLYRSFASKDDLIVAYLSGRNEYYWKAWDERFAPYADEPRRYLREVMLYLVQRTTQPGYRGCPFINYAAEFADSTHPGHAVVRINKEEMRHRLLRLSEAVGARAPLQLADGLMLLIEGTYAISQTLGGPDGPGSALFAAAEALIDQAIMPKPVT